MSIPNRNLRSVFDYLGLSNIEVAKTLHYDPSLISRYLSGQRHLKAASPQLDAIAELILSRSQRVRDVEWLTEQFVAAGLPTEMATVVPLQAKPDHVAGDRWGYAAPQPRR